MSLKGKVIAQIGLDCGLPYGMAILNNELYTASHDDDDGGIFTVNLEDRTFEKVIGNGTECSKVHSLTVYDYKILFSDVGNHSLNVWNPAPVNAARFPEMAKERGMANVPNICSQRVYLVYGSSQSFLGTEAQTQGPQGTVSSVVVEDERWILLALGEIRDLF